jgi:hypothetical protein
MQEATRSNRGRRDHRDHEPVAQRVLPRCEAPKLFRHFNVPTYGRGWRWTDPC